MVLKLLALWKIVLFPYIDNLVVVYKCVKIKKIKIKKYFVVLRDVY